MKTKKIIAVILVILALIAMNSVYAQTLSVKAKVLLDGKQITNEKVKITVINLDTLSEFKNQSFETNKPFNYQFKNDNEYLIVFQKNGYQSKSILIRTNINSSEKFLYTFNVNLSSKNIIPNTVEYAGGIYYNEHKKEFDYYLTSNIKN